MKPKIPLPSPRLSMWHAKTNTKSNGGALGVPAVMPFHTLNTSASLAPPPLAAMSRSAWLEQSHILPSEGVQRKPSSALSSLRVRQGGNPSLPSYLYL